MAYIKPKPDEDPDDFADRMAKMFPPGQVDRQIRQALQFCWMSLPKKKRNLDDFEKEARRIFDRAIRDFRDDGGKAAGGV